MEDRIFFSERPISVDDFIGQYSAPSHGAQVLFLGVVRNENLGRRVRSVSYDAYTPLAENVFREITEEAKGKWGASVHVSLVHRTGNLAIGEVSVLSFVTSPHRHEAYEVSRYLIEELKKRAPIWKKEFYEDGESEWLKGHALCGHHSEHLT